MENKIDHVKESKGNLPYMLYWQSLDGRLQVEYIDTVEIAAEKFDWLKKLGRQPKLYHEVDWK